MRRWASSIIGILTAIFVLGAAAADPVVPRIVVQRSHAGPVDAAAWTSDSRYLISASAADRSVILWDVASGAIVDRLTFPVFADPADFEPAKVVSVAVAPGDGAATLRVLAVRGRAGEPLAGARYTVSLDLIHRTFAIAGPPMVKEGSQSPGDYDLTSVTTSLPATPLPVSPDGKYRLERLGERTVASVCQSAAYGLTVATIDRSVPARMFTGSPRGLFDDIDLSPDGTLMSRLVTIYGGGTTLVQLWDLRAGRALPTLIKAHRYDRVRWIDPKRYVVSVGAPVSAPTLLVEARSAGGPRGETAGKIESRCLQTPLGADGALAAVDGDGACAMPGMSDGKVLLHPAGADGGWLERLIPALEGRVITSLTASPAGDRLAVFTRGSKTDGSDPAPSVIFVDLKHGWKLDLPTTSLPVGDRSAAPSRMIFSDDGRLLIFASAAGIHVLTLAGGSSFVIPTKISRPVPLASDGATILVGGAGPQALERYSALSGQALPLNTVALGARTGRFIVGKPLFWTASDDGTVRFWDARDGALIVTFVSFANNQFFAYTEDGRYDTNLGADSDALRWLVSDHPFQSLPSATFMRQYYQPGLIPTVLNCAVSRTCASVLAPIPSVAALDRALPAVKIPSVRPSSRPFSAKIDVEATGPNLFDLRLFRNDQLVARYPEPVGPANAALDTTAAWRAASRVPGAGPTVRHTFEVDVPSDDRPVEFKAYAFNEDRVKGETSPVFTYTPPSPREAVSTSRPAKPVPWEQTARGPGPDFAARGRKAYVIAVGVNAYDIPGRSLRFAVNDALSLSGALRAIPGYEVVPIVLTSDGNVDHAKKADLEAVIERLAGKSTGRALLAADGVPAGKVTRATPDDLVILAFSGHGFAAGHGDFYILPSDTRVTAKGEPIPGTMISSAELSAWFSGVDAGEIAMIIDACHSAASVNSGDFRPGPMGDPGLGQLAFDKGIRILAAAQADEEAQEDAKLGQGLLSYTLVKQGLGVAHEGDFMLDKWLKGAADNLVAVRSAPKRAGHVLVSMDDDDAEPVQQPALFDFNGRPSLVVLRPAGAIAP